MEYVPAGAKRVDLRVRCFNKGALVGGCDFFGVNEMGVRRMFKKNCKNGKGLHGHDDDGNKFNIPAYDHYTIKVTKRY